MKKALAISLFLTSGVVMAKDTYVHGYYRSNGTYVQPHHRTTPDSNVYNNYSTEGNVNPYTGQSGNVNPYTYQQPSYQHQPTCFYSQSGEFVCR